MKMHNGQRRINNVDGGKGEARRAYHKAVRRQGRMEVARAIGQTPKFIEVDWFNFFKLGRGGNG